MEKIKLDKNSTIMIILLFILSSLFIGALIYSTYLKNNIFEEISSDLKYKSTEINRLVNKLEDDTIMFANSKEVLELFSLEFHEHDFSQELVYPTGIKKKAEDVTIQIENYLNVFPDKTLEELQNSTEFKKIAIQKVGDTGYTAIIDYKISQIIFHPNKNFINFDIYNFKDKFPELFKIFENSQGGNEAEGIYNWEEIDNTISKKYMYVKPLKESYNLNYSVTATTYIDEYKFLKHVTNEIDSKLKKSVYGLGYYNLALISKEGYVIYNTNENESLGINLAWPEYKTYGITNNFILVKENNKLISYGPYNIFGVEGNFMSTIVPVNKDNELLGYIILKNKLDELFKVINDELEFDTYKSYLVNKDMLIISPSFENITMLIQSVYYEGLEFCFDSYFNLENINNKIEFREHLDFKRDEVLSRYEKIDGIDWCLISQINQEEVEEKSNIFG
ncbi:MAG: hypothetical protein HRU03_03830 [Nanoarchaeales archaeon]|nr:hypothetical protein [Nanoarchaeales archaeon]